MFTIRRVNAIGNVFHFGLQNQWRIEWQAGVGGYKLRTYKTLTGARATAEWLAEQYPGQTISILDAEGRVLETRTYPGNN